MKLFLFAVHDSKVGAYAAPMSMRAKGEAVRSFQSACQDDTLPFKKHPADFSLWFVAEFDDSTGLVMPVTPERVIGADEF